MTELIGLLVYGASIAAFTFAWVFVAANWEALRARLARSNRKPTASASTGVQGR